MAVLPAGIKRGQAVEIFGKVAQTNYYLLNFSGFADQGPLSDLTKHLRENFGVDTDHVLNKTGMMCSEATLPGSSLATAEVKDNFMGIPQEYAHTRLYTDIDFTFYIDRSYTNLKFFEGWIDYIASASETRGPIGDGADIYSSNYYRRMRYPDSYKSSSMFITKFERDIQGPTIRYQFINAFPKLVTAVPVSYGGADVLRVSVSFNYDRYIVNPQGSYKTAPPNTFDPESGRAMYKPASERTTQETNVTKSVARRTDTLTPPPPPPAKPTGLTPETVRNLTVSLGGDPDAPVQNDTVTPTVERKTFGFDDRDGDGVKEFRLFGAPIFKYN